jgi:hypothetical protein
MRRLLRSSRIESLEHRRYLTSANYTWNDVAIGGGGFVTGIFYDPGNANVMYARTDVGGLFKSVNDGGNWTRMNFNNVANSNGVLSFAIDPENSNNLYADTGLYSGTDGYLLYSTNAGATWNSVPLSFYVGGNMDGRGDGERLAVDPYDSNIIFLGTNANGLWESTNAGHSFSQVTSFSTSASINLVLFDPYGGTAGNPTQEIFVGEGSTASGTNLLKTTNGGSSWAQITGTGSVPTGWMPGRAVMAPDGNLYVAYANDQAPTEPTNGGLMRYNTSTGVWTNISPVVPQRSSAPYDYFGYCGLALDPNSPTTLVTTSLDRYNYGDTLWRTTNANTASPSWVALYSATSNNGAGGYNTTRNSTNAPYTAGPGDSIGNWACSVAIDPFNSAQIMYDTGGGISATNYGAASSALTAPNSWYFPDNGLEMTAVLSLAATTGGTPLYSGLGDVAGFAHTTLSYSPQQGDFAHGTDSNGDSVDYASLAPNDTTVVGNWGNTQGMYSTNGGVNFTRFASNPSGATGSSAYSDGTVAISANASTIVWAPSNHGPYYTTNNGATWTATNLVAPVASLNQNGGTPTVVTSSANNFVVGQYVTISGATPSAYDGTFTISSIVNSTTFTYSDANVTSGTTSPGTGAITASLNGTILSDKVNPNYFYYWSENSTWNGWTLYISSNGGQTFSPSAGGTIGTGQVDLAVNPLVAGQLWMTNYNGIEESTNFGASFNHLGSWSSNYTSVAVGASAPGSSYPSIYVWGTPAGDSFQGIYRSDDGGNTWLQINDVTTQWGYPLATDPNIFGRLYAATGGIIAGNPATSLPANWLDADINDPGNPGWATSSTNLSTGATVNQWNVVGGGAGFSSAPIAISSLSRTGGVATAVTTTASGLQIGQTITIAGAANSAYDGTFVVTGLYNTVAGLNNDIGAATEFTFAVASGTDTASGTITATLDDQFNFAYEPVSGSASISAQIRSITNADAGGGTPQSGVMYRAGNSPADPFFAVAQTPAGSAVLEYRTTSGGSISTQTISGIAVGSEYFKIIRNGSTFAGYYSANGTTWTQIGASVSITAMPTVANAGLMATAVYNPQLTDATFNNVNVVLGTSGPSVVNAAAATPNPVTGTTTALSVLGSDSGGQSSLTYTWAATALPTGAAAPSFSVNGTNAAQNTTATFSAAGTYTLQATITDTGGLTVISSVSVTVNQTLASVTVTPASAGLNENQTESFAATGYDQFGKAMTSQPAFTWSRTGIGSINGSSGVYTAPGSAGSATVTATSGLVSGSATVTVANANPVVTTVAAAAPSPVPGTSAVLSVSASDDGGSANLSYSWAATTLPSGAASPTYSANGTNAANTSTATFSTAGVYVFTVTISDGQGGTASSSVSVTVNQTLNSATVSPATAGLNENQTQTFTATGYDQFGNPMTAQPTFIWSRTGIGSVNPRTGVYTTQSVTGTGTVIATSGSITGTATVTVTDSNPVVAATTASPSPVAGTTTVLSVSASSDAGAASLRYTWVATALPPGVASPTFSVNGTNSANSSTATFSAAGVYSFTVTITDGQGGTASSNVNVMVDQTPTKVVVNPSSLTLPISFGQQYSASVTDQFGNAIASPSFSWNISGSANAISAGGNATLGSTPGSYTVTATDGSAIGSAALIAENFAVPSESTLDLTLGPAGAVALSQNGANLTASQNGVQMSFTGITAVAVTDSGSGDAFNFNSPIALPFSFASSGSSIINVNTGTLTLAANPGGSVGIGTLAIAAGASAVITPTTSHTTTVNLQSLTVASGGTFDLTNNKVLINYGAGPDPMTILAGQIANGYTGGLGSAGSIISSSASTAPATTVGYADAADSGDPAGLPAGTLEIRYTYYGDANLDGTVTSSDYSRIDNGYLGQLTGWDNGDFNDDGVVNGSDYTLSDNAFNTQGAQILARIAADTKEVVAARVPNIAPGTPASNPASIVENAARSIGAKKPKPLAGFLLLSPVARGNSRPDRSGGIPWSVVPIAIIGNHRFNARNPRPGNPGGWEAAMTTDALKCL